MVHRWDASLLVPRTVRERDPADVLFRAESRVRLQERRGDQRRSSFRKLPAQDRQVVVPLDDRGHATAHDASLLHRRLPVTAGAELDDWLLFAPAPSGSGIHRLLMHACGFNPGGDMGADRDQYAPHPGGGTGAGRPPARISPSISTSGQLGMAYLEASRGFSGLRVGSRPAGTCRQPRIGRLCAPTKVTD